MEVGVANATKKNLDLHVALSGIASRDRRRRQRRHFTGDEVGFRFVRTATDTSCISFNEQTEIE
jgi:hypothetical protein